MFVSLLAVMLSSPLGLSRANGPNAVAISPDHRYVAMTVNGEAECSYLYVLKLKPHSTHRAITEARNQARAHAVGEPRARKPVGTLFRRMDVDSFLWVPGKPHDLLYGESEIYGDGLVGLLNVGGKPRALARPNENEFQIMLKSYDSTRRLLTYEVTACHGAKSVTKTRHLTVRGS